MAKIAKNVIGLSISIDFSPPEDMDYSIFVDKIVEKFVIKCKNVENFL